MMDVIEIVDGFLSIHGYDGLYSGVCACAVGDLAPCGQIDGSCMAGYKHVHSKTGDSIISSRRSAIGDDEIQEIIDSI
jgi:hypothetical protein